jgi:hypothetical protein
MQWHHAKSIRSAVMSNTVRNELMRDLHIGIDCVVNDNTKFVASSTLEMRLHQAIAWLVKQT